MHISCYKPIFDQQRVVKTVDLAYFNSLNFQIKWGH